VTPNRGMATAEVDDVTTVAESLAATAEVDDVTTVAESLAATVRRFLSNYFDLSF